MIRIGTLLCIVALTLTPATAPAQDSTAPVGVGPGDMLRVTVWGQPEFSGELQVGRDGFPVHPIYRDIQVVGLSRDQLEDRFDAVLRQWQEHPRFVVEPLLQIPVTGGVLQPGVVSVPAGATIVEAVLAAGGVTVQGDAVRVQLRRAGETSRFELNSEVGRTPVRSGDVLTVLERSDRSVLRDFIVPIGTLISTTISVITILSR